MGRSDDITVLFDICYEIISINEQSIFSVKIYFRLDDIYAGN